MILKKTHRLTIHFFFTGSSYPKQQYGNTNNNYPKQQYGNNNNYGNNYGNNMGTNNLYDIKGLVAYLLRSPKPLPADLKNRTYELAQI